MPVSTQSPDTIAVIGGGIGGLAAALALLRRGLDVEVYEQSSALKEVGAGISISANGTRVLNALGLEAALARTQVVPSRREIRHWRTGETWNWYELGERSLQRYGTRHVYLHRGDLHGLLAEAVRTLKPEAIRLGKRCVAITQSDAQVEIRFETGEPATAAYAIGADGIHSTVRETLFGPGRPEFTGCVAWRGLVPIERLQSDTSGVTGTNWLGPHGHVLQYPVRRGELMNFVGFVERDDWQIESWTQAGTTQELANDFRGWHADVQAIIENIETPFKWALMARGPMARWTMGRITLLGDACHPTLPFLGQGAVMAIEDGYGIAACLERYFDQPAFALCRYEDVRREWTAAVVRKSHENRKQAFSPALAEGDAVAASIARDWQQVRVEERLSWLFEYDATTLEI